MPAKPFIDLASALQALPCAVACAIVACSPGAPRSEGGANVPRFAAAPATNITDGCAAGYDTTVDYFPNKATIRYSKQIRVEYRKHYKVLTISPRGDSTKRLQYALVQCGTPHPDGFPPLRVIEVPVRRFIVSHPDYTSAVDLLGVTDRLVGVQAFKLITSPGVRARADSGRIAQVNSQEHLDVERIVALRPDVVLAYWSVSPQWNAHPKLAEVGIKTGVMVAHWEEAPLAQTEWLKVLGLYFNREQRAERAFDDIAARYESLSARAKAVPKKPVVLLYLPNRDNWSIARPERAAVRRIVDAGGRYFWSSVADSVSFPIAPLERVLASGRHADAWLDVPARMSSVSEILATDSRLGLFDAVRNGAVYSFGGGAERDGRRPYTDQWLTKPDIILADLVKAFHPELVPNHAFTIMRRLAPAAAFSEAAR
jgi:iron complex transport system substrate-binding protein